MCRMLAGEHSTVLTREDYGCNFFIFSQDPNNQTTQILRTDTDMRLSRLF